MRVKALVIRRPVFMEDEGGYKIAMQFTSKDEADTWVKDQEGEFFHPTDYIVVDLNDFPNPYATEQDD